jgi:hypothetical protein
MRTTRNLRRMTRFIGFYTQGGEAYISKRTQKRKTEREKRKKVKERQRE